MRTSFRHQSEAQPPNGLLNSDQPRYPISMPSHAVQSLSVRDEPGWVAVSARIDCRRGGIAVAIWRRPVTALRA
jgi:hypothetical protein